jgi:hypothetical protein
MDTAATMGTDVFTQLPSDLDELLDEAEIRADRSDPVSTPLRTQVIVGSIAIVALSGVVVFAIAAFGPSVAVGVGFVVDRLSAGFIL